MTTANDTKEQDNNEMTPEGALIWAFNERSSWQAAGPHNLATLIANHVTVPVKELWQEILAWIKASKIVRDPDNGRYCNYRLA